MILYDYICPRHGAFESLETMGKTVSACPHCGKDSKRQLTMPHLNYYRMGVDPDMTTAADKWAQMHIRQAKREQAWGPDDNSPNHLET